MAVELVPKSKPKAKAKDKAKQGDQPVRDVSLVESVVSESAFTFKLFMPILTPIDMDVDGEVGELCRSECDVSSICPAPQQVAKAKAKPKKATSFCVS